MRRIGLAVVLALGLFVAPLAVGVAAAIVRLPPCSLVLDAEVAIFGELAPGPTESERTHS